MTNRKPIREIKLGSVRAAIWQKGLANGRVTYSVSFSRPYKENGTWHDATSFERSELLLVAQAAEMALNWVYAQPGGENPIAGEE